MANKAHHSSSGEIQKLKDPVRWVLKPKALNIVWGNDSRYWKINEEGPVELVQVCWLEVTGSTNENLKKGKNYEVNFVVEMKDEGFGWNGCPVFIMAKIGKKGKFKWDKVNFSDLPKNVKTQIPNGGFVLKVPQDLGSDDTVLHFGLYEVWTGKWKGGLLIHEVQVKELTN
ncbi:phloem protein 2-A9 [Euphorbia peplus]|nr:phloem protein 2-A9 [Euphorbia peplus]